MSNQKCYHRLNHAFNQNGFSVLLRFIVGSTLLVERISIQSGLNYLARKLRGRYLLSSNRQTYVR